MKLNFADFSKSLRNSASFANERIAEFVIRAYEGMYVLFIPNSLVQVSYFLVECR